MHKICTFFDCFICGSVSLAQVNEQNQDTTKRLFSRKVQSSKCPVCLYVRPSYGQIYLYQFSWWFSINYIILVKRVREFSAERIDERLFQAKRMLLMVKKKEVKLRKDLLPNIIQIFWSIFGSNTTSMLNPPVLKWI
jgi:hypothetical protein